MRKNKNEAALFARYISDFLYDYAPCFLTHSDHTIKSYRDTINLYVAFLEGEGITPASFGRKAFEKPLIEMILSRLVDTFSSRILYPMLLLSGNHSIAVV